MLYKTETFSSRTLGSGKKNSAKLEPVQNHGKHPRWLLTLFLNKKTEV